MCFFKIIGQGMSSQAGIAISEMIKKNSSITKLDILGTGNSSDAFRAIGSGLAMNNSLTDIQLPRLFSFFVCDNKTHHFPSDDFYNQNEDVLCFMADCLSTNTTLTDLHFPRLFSFHFISFHLFIIIMFFQW